MAKLETLGPQGEAVVQPPAVPEPPQVFVRTFTTPPGLPWDQARAADLEARHGSPLPIADLMHRVRRLEAWAPGRAARHAVFYVRRRDYTRPFETTVDVDGAPVRVTFGSTGEHLQRLRNAALVAVAVAMAATVVGLPVIAALGARAEAEAQLARLEQRAAGKARQAERVERDRLRSRSLVRAQGKSGVASEVVADLRWLSQARAPDARVVAVHWDHGLMAVESRGDKPPVVAIDRRVVRADKPIRPGVWIWGLAPLEPAAVPEPVAAEFRQ